MSQRDLTKWAPAARLRDQLPRCGLFTPAAAGGGPIVLARAPGRLDVMGGIADYTGSLVCELPLNVAAAVAVQARTDGRIVCRSMQEAGTVAVPTGAVLSADPLAVRRLFDDAGAWAQYPAGCAWWLGQRRTKHRKGKRLGSPGSAPAMERGVSILIDSDVPLGGGVSSSAAIEVATMTALADLWGVALLPLELAAACQVVENRVVGAPCGVMDQVTSCMGEADAMLEILCQPGKDGLPAQVRRQVRVPRGYAFVGIHSGVRHEVKGDPYTDTRVAAFMGQKILSGRPYGCATDGHLANVDPATFGAALWGVLLDDLTGRDFLAQYGGTNDPVTRVCPEKVYHVRSATTHHVWEMARVRRFVALLRGGAVGKVLEQRMIQAGLLMYGSHRSYGECAKMGHPMTDKLVEMVRQRGPAQGFYGAKITGGGCGGTVAILIRDQPVVRARVEEIRAQYARETGRQTMLFDGSSPGAAALGTLRVEL